MAKMDWGVSDGACDFCGYRGRIVVYCKQDFLAGGTVDMCLCRDCLSLIHHGVGFASAILGDTRL